MGTRYIKSRGMQDDETNAFSSPRVNLRALPVLGPSPSRSVGTCVGGCCMRNREGQVRGNFPFWFLPAIESCASEVGEAVGLIGSALAACGWGRRGISTGYPCVPPSAHTRCKYRLHIRDGIVVHQKPDATWSAPRQLHCVMLSYLAFPWVDCNHSLI